MALSITAAIARIKSGVSQWLTPEAIQGLCRAVGYEWRERVLDPVTTIHLFVLQILHGNTACAHVPRLGNIECTGEAYGQARSRLPLSVFRGLLMLIVNRLPVSTSDEGRWHGHRTFLLDGSTASMPDTAALQRKYGQPGAQAPGCGFPVMHLMAVFQATTGFLIKIASAPWRTHDMSQVEQLHPDLQAGDVLVGDRGLCSFVHLVLLGVRGVFGVFRTHQKQIVNFRPGRGSASRKRRKRGEKKLPTSKWLKRLGKNDQLVEYVKPKTRPKWMSAEDYAKIAERLVVRELRYSIAIPGCRTKQITLTTTLLDPEQYPAADLAELYGQRWQVETNFKHVKTTLKMEVLRCQTVEGVEKELTMYALVYNLIRLVMLEASRRQSVAVERISFVDAARWLAQAMRDATPLKLHVNPNRPHRVEPRATKRRPKSYGLLNRPRQVLRKQLMGKKHTA
jgi:Transposase DDE domain